MWKSYKTVEEGLKKTKTGMDFDYVKDKQIDEKIMNLDRDTETVLHLMLEGIDPLKLTQVKDKNIRSCFSSVETAFME